jgi:hypothetical protein
MSLAAVACGLVALAVVFGSVVTAMPATTAQPQPQPPSSPAPPTASPCDKYAFQLRSPWLTDPFDGPTILGGAPGGTCAITPASFCFGDSSVETFTYSPYGTATSSSSQIFTVAYDEVRNKTGRTRVTVTLAYDPLGIGMNLTALFSFDSTACVRNRCHELARECCGRVSRGAENSQSRRTSDFSDVRQCVAEREWADA